MARTPVKSPLERGPGKPLDAEQVARTIGVLPETLEKWAREGLVQPRHGHYDFRDVVALRTVSELVAQGATLAAIKRSIAGFRAAKPELAQPLAQLKVHVSDKGRIVADVDGALLTGSGQLEMKFGAPAPHTSGPTRFPVHFAPNELREAGWWIEQGLESEDAGDLVAAAKAYRRAIRLAPGDPVAQLNLGNVLLAQGRLGAARERLLQAAALAPDDARAWFNLAHVQERVGQLKSAAKSLRRAIRADPRFADAYFNLADLCQRLGDDAEAARCWKAYLRLDSNGEWATEARRRLGALRSSA